jgi:hypothetical protein
MLVIDAVASFQLGAFRADLTVRRGTMSHAALSPASWMGRSGEFEHRRSANRRADFPMIGRDWYGDKPLPFATWLLERAERHGQLGAVIAMAEADESFPAHGCPDKVRRHLGMSDEDKTLDDAELDWMCA